MLRFVLAFASLVPVPVVFAADPAQGAPDFTREIQPILVEHCYACHGPDAKSRKADLRLDTKDGVASAAPPGQPKDSELLARVTSAEDDEVMPPKKFGKPLKPEQIAKLKLWIQAGARWNEHWAFVAPKKAPVPNGTNPIDHFIRERLKKDSLAANPAAPKTAWLRRATFDLTGLPPTPKEIDVFLADTSLKAYEAAVDRLLASPRFGEHMARFWLDSARYGDTHGLHLDNYREMWLYRDWVIRAFNENKRYDRFLVEQLAGDLMPNATTEQKVATGFLRCNITTSEGGVIEEECYVRNVVDVTDTYGSVVLGLTVGCARCHDHKYDPLSQKDYYSLFAYFNSIDGSALDGNAARHAPVLPVPTAEQTKRLEELRARLAAVNGKIADAIAKSDYQDTATGKAAVGTTRREVVWVDDAIPAGATETPEVGFNRKWVFAAKTEREPVAGERSVKLDAKGLMQVVATDAKPGLRVGEGDTLFAHVWIDPKNPPKEIMIQWHTTGWSHRVYWGENRIDWGQDRTAERRPRGELPEAGKWVKLEIPVAQVGIKPGATISGIAFTQFDGTVYWDKAGLNTATPQGDRRFDRFADWASGVGSDTSVPQAIRDLLKLDAAKRTDAQTKQLRDYFVEHGYTKTRDIFEPLHKERTELSGAIAKLDGEVPTSYVFKERATPRPAFILKRGEYDQRGEPVQRATPKALASLQKEIPKNRLEMANWIVGPNHPLAARVAVNRFWQQVFGTGLVKTADDFGSQGEVPSHPELLDWLAVDFRDGGWDVKRLLKSFVLSDTYRQSANATPDKLAKDPQNRLLARGPRFRLDAEMVRDQALAAGGLLVESFGGPSVKPPQPAGLWEAVGYTSSNTARFMADRGADKVHRRSLYTFWKRTSPPPQMTALDAPSREACTVRRERTNTPLQALLLMNETQFVEASRAAAERALAEGDDDPIGHLFKVAASRPATAEELAILTKTYETFRASFEKEPARAAKLVAIGETKPNPKLDTVKLAALTLVANTVFNLDEVLTK
jgi:mono/diheme cytochrome c family protein